MFADLLYTFYLAVAIQIGISHLVHTIWSLPLLVLVLFGQRFIARKHFHRLLFCEYSFSFLLLHNNLWPVLPFSFFLLTSVAACIALLVITHNKEISVRHVSSFAVLTLPAFFYLLDKDHYQLVDFRNEWRLLSEQGSSMSWITRVLHGQTLFKDAIVARGPLMIYSSAIVMQFFGETMVIHRAWLLILNLAMSYSFYFFCKTFIKSKWLLWITFIILLLIHNFSYRQGFAVLALAMAALSVRRGTRLEALLSGMASSLALLASTEAGVCSILAVGGAAMIGWFLHAEQRPAYVKLIIGFVAGFFFVLLPFLAYLLFRGELTEVIQGIILYPKYFSKGFMSLPFPSFLRPINLDLEAGRFWFSATIKFLLVWYVPPLIYIFTFFLLISWGRYKTHPSQIGEPELGILLLTIFGWFLFHSALGRSDFQHLYFAIPPAFALLGFHADRLLTDKNKAQFDPGKLLHLSIAGIFVVLFLLIRSSDLVIPFYKVGVENMMGTARVKEVLVPFRIERLRGTLTPSWLRDRIENVVQQIQSRREAGDAIFVFPNMALYYFVLDTPPPTRFDLAYHAITKEMRLEGVEDLKRARPRFVIYSTDPRQGLDRIPVEISAPEIVEYLQENYRVWKVFGTDQILIPKPTKQELEERRKLRRHTQTQ